MLASVASALAVAATAGRRADVHAQAESGSPIIASTAVPKAHYAPAGPHQSPTRFADRLRGAPALPNFDVGFAFTPPVPDPADPGAVIVYAFMRRGLPPAAPKVLAPEFRILAGWLGADVRAVHRVTPAALGLTLADGETLGAVVPPPPFDRPMSWEAMTAAAADFERAQTAVLDASARRQPIDRVECRRYKGLVPVYATPPPIPLLRRASPAFFAAVDACAA